MERWLEQSGAIGLDGLELATFPATGRGVRTLRRFKRGDEILTIPRSVLWTVEHADADALLGPALRSVQPPLSVEDTLATYLLFVRSRDSGYDGMRSHVEALPKSYSSSIFFSEDELEICAGSSLYTITKQLEESIEDDYRSLVVRLLVQHRDLFPLNKFTIDDYKWALCSVWSRSMDFVLPDGNSIRLLAPFADMLNHSPEAEPCHVYNASTGSLSVVAGKDYEAGDQAFIYYGSIPNSRLLRLYGFVVPGNPNESYDLVLATHPAAPLFEQKHELWVSAGLDSNCTIPLTLTDPLPSKVLRYLCIQRADASDLAAMALQQGRATEGRVSVANEVGVLRSLVESFSGILESFGKSLEKLEEGLTAGVYPPGGNKWAAAHVSIGEQRVLRLAKTRAEELLSAVESGSGSAIGSGSASARCANCGNAPAQLMLCGRCKAVLYCGRACQVAHFKGHKTICRATASKSG